MVERPIKKSERQAQANADNSSENTNSVPPIESTPIPKSSKPSGNRSSGKGKKAAYADENKPPVNPALARGPKPSKIKPIVKTEPEPETEPETEPISEESQES
ncbi:MAG: hypothetical protein KME21_22300 [Desmonostoc vinosum HA7617-LM4]|jgi:hypothetical protein|nr:hypothetical protein [Desmonostoc vinosum HA7617-LM4]